MSYVSGEKRKISFSAVVSRLNLVHCIAITRSHSTHNRIGKQIDNFNMKGKKRDREIVRI